MKTQHSSLDRISNLPSCIIETILCRVPIKEAARTSILSREWRYKWIKIPKLTFKEHKFDMPTKRSCPLLKTLTLLIYEENILGDDKSTYIELFKCLSAIESLTTSTWVTSCFDPEVVPQELPTSLVSLKYLSVEQMCLFDYRGLPFLFLLIRSSPNLVKLVLEIFVSSATDQVLIEDSKDDPITLEQYSDIWMGHLNEMEIDNFVDLPHLLDIVKLIMAKSPMLKKVSIWLYNGVTKDEESKIRKILLSSPRASPLVEITFERYD
ncbi:F-box/FBD/LRR-repeat protein [Tanacetum coccineum]